MQLVGKSTLEHKQVTRVVPMRGGVELKQYIVLYTPDHLEL
jgi:hypothetical protein